MSISDTKQVLLIDQTQSVDKQCEDIAKVSISHTKHALLIDQTQSVDYINSAKTGAKVSISDTKHVLLIDQTHTVDRQCEDRCQSADLTTQHALLIDQKQTAVSVKT